MTHAISHPQFQTRPSPPTMTAAPSTISGIPSTPSQLQSSTPHPHNHHVRHRLKAFALPDGRKVHIASSPEEATSLRQQLTQSSLRSGDAPTATPSESPFDLVISGSPEHVEALRQAHGHYTRRQEALRQKHGEELLDEFEDVRKELEALGSEIHNVTDHAVRLDANFGRFGYSAHLRTYDDAGGSEDGAGEKSGASSEHESRDWEKERRNGRVMKLWKKPVVRQYFHKGLLWRASDSTEVASFELFVDLLYVGILAINGDRASEDPNGTELLRFAVTFILSWKIWSDVALIISWFETDDFVQVSCISAALWQYVSQKRHG